MYVYKKVYTYIISKCIETTLCVVPFLRERIFQHTVFCLAFDAGIERSYTYFLYTIQYIFNQSKQNCAVNFAPIFFVLYKKMRYVCVI